MEVMPLKNMDAVTLDNLTLGDCYRTQNGNSIYMVIKASTVNAVAIETGHTFKHNGNYLVYPVTGHFWERKENK